MPGIGLLASPQGADAWHEPGEQGNENRDDDGGGSCIFGRHEPVSGRAQGDDDSDPQRDQDAEVEPPRGAVFGPVFAGEASARFGANPTRGLVLLQHRGYEGEGHAGACNEHVCGYGSIGCNRERERQRKALGDAER